ncbi:hypothetical protein MASR2M8_05760 [Opitutaceae bacterium]
MLGEELIERERLKGCNEAKCLPGRKTAHRLKYGGHGRLMSRNERSDVELERGVEIG